MAVLAFAIGCARASLSASGSTTFPGRNGRIAVTRGPYDALGVLGKRGGFRPLVRGDILFGHSFSRDGKRIVYTYSEGEPDYFLGIVNVATGRHRTVRTGKISALRPSFLRDGRIVFEGSTYPRNKRQGTYVVNTDGSGRHMLFAKESLAESSDGRWFVATDRRGIFRKLFLLNARGRRVRTLAGDGSHYFLNPSFSPNGRWITFERVRDNTYLDADLFVIRRDGTHLRRLTFGGHAEDPVFSPDGRWIAFRRVKDRVGGNIIALSVGHPGRRRMLTHVRGARFAEPAWARR